MDLDDEELEVTKNLRNKCKCCKEIEFIERLNKVKITNVKRILRATITSFTKRDYDTRYSRSVDYKSVDLNYCPVCGRKLKKGK